MFARKRAIFGKKLEKYFSNKKLPCGFTCLQYKNKGCVSLLDAYDQIQIKIEVFTQASNKTKLLKNSNCF